MSEKIIEKHLNKILEFIDINPEIKIEKEEETFNISINGENLNFLIGYRGESLDALSHILSHAIYKESGEWLPIFLDINGYKNEKIEKLHEMVKSFIDRARFHQKEIGLPPLTPQERRFVHMFISDYVDIKSESRGEGRDRRLYLIPVKK
ncbi:hypothetical protein A2V49_00460 [candidate division WWE3 bacterium RBG_19FT_COMBO_34_6]|uniref:R3H domain-containing protein n=1 Tax=candidate division WWE3 bacterium RBG_19FT_COMBO_34_6 TaxID=1802612 RepID=A0A1F4UNI0_UNCKA|nr:MAG: hypothetical protein A2V49_00460 [candidate division WWE3 bacterium RBG_19FT_COMBO_34_6]